MFLETIKTFKGIGGALGGLFLVIYLESILLFPEALSFYLVPASLLAGLLGYALCTQVAGPSRIRWGLIGTAISLLIVVVLLQVLSSDRIFVIWGIVLFSVTGNISLFLLLGEAIEKFLGPPPPPAAQ